MKSALYIRDPDWYAGDDPLGYAEELGCQGVALQSRIRAHREMLPEAVARFGAANVTIYDLPSEYIPEKWERTMDRAADLALVHSVGVLVDAETARRVPGETIGWLAAEREAQRLGERLAQLGRDLPGQVGLTSFPAHPRWGMWAEICRRADSPVYGSVQIYGTAGFPRSEWLDELRDWNDKWPLGVVPSVALGTWRRNPMSTEEYVRYLDDMRDAIVNAGAPGPVLLWHGSVPETDSPKYLQAKAWLAEEPAPRLREGEERPSKKRGGVGWLIALGAVGAAVAWFARSC